jgi:hypothetical protein
MTYNDAPPCASPDDACKADGVHLEIAVETDGVQTDTTTAQPTPVDFIKALFGYANEQPYICSLPNLKDDPAQAREQHITTRKPGMITWFVEKWDKAGRGLFICVGTVNNGAKRNKETTKETVCLHADIDFKDVDLLDADARGYVLRQLARLKYQPSITVFSGNGVHAYWLFREAMQTQGNIKRIEAALHLLADAVAGDTKVCGVQNLMRLPGSHNTKEGAWTEVGITNFDPDRRYEFDDLEEWLAGQSPVMLRKKRETGKTAGESDFWKFYVEQAKKYGWAPPIDVEQRLANMIYMGAEENSIHVTQRDVTAALLSRGYPIDEVVERVLKATEAAAGEYGQRWKWEIERRKIERDAEKWVKKHPDIKERQQRRQAEQSADDDVVAASDRTASSAASASVEAPPGIGHNSNGKPPPLHIMIADAFIAGMLRGIGQLLRARA